MVLSVKWNIVMLKLQFSKVSDFSVVYVGGNTTFIRYYI